MFNIDRILEDDKYLDTLSTDGSVFKVKPIAYYAPKTREELSGLVKFSNKHQIQLTVRGRGTDQGGGALGQGIIVLTEPYLNNAHHFNRSKKTIKVQPGVNYAALQDYLKKLGYFLPPYPASIAYATIGGAVANNAAGEMSYKYGSTKDYVVGLDIILSDGSTATIGEHRSFGNSFIKKIYKEIRNLLNDNKRLIRKTTPITSKYNSGYDIWAALLNNGSIDLRKLIVGSQGTLALVSEIELKPKKIIDKNRVTILASFDNLLDGYSTIKKLGVTDPTCIEMVDCNLLKKMRTIDETIIERIFSSSNPELVLIIEYENSKSVSSFAKLMLAEKILSRLATTVEVSRDPVRRSEFWAIRRSSAAKIWQLNSKKKALPIMEDACVVAEEAGHFLTAVDRLLSKHNIEYATWGHAGNGNFHIQPLIDLGTQTGRELVKTIVPAFNKIVHRYKGVPCAEHNDGLIRGHYIDNFYPKEIVSIFESIKNIFDPYNIFNPLNKLGAREIDIYSLLRDEYSVNLNKIEL